MSEVLSKRMLKAAEFASVAHLGQERKAPKGVPYVSHCFIVAFVLSTLGYPEDVVVEGMLHDVVEDTGYTMKDISREFGETVASYISGVTEQDKSLPWDGRKKAYRERLGSQLPEVKAISAVDLLANRLALLSCLDSGDSSVLSQFKAPLGTMLENDKLRIAIIEDSIPIPLLDQIRRVEAHLATYLLKEL